MIRRWRGLALAGVVVAAPVAWVAPEAGTRLVVNRPVESPDAIVSLSSHEWDRLPETIRLARLHPGARILLTLPADVNEYNCHDCGGRVALLVRGGIDRGRIHVLPIKSSGTYGEAEVVREFIRAQPVERLLIVTSPYHTRRALATFQTLLAGTGVQIGIISANATSSAHPDAWWWTSFDRWYVRYEWVAIVYYEVRHGVNALTTAGR